ncbi:MAG: hypothetical protein Ta2E_06120 [Mycoplasmoidaceae bacterium]|nr:MAG: hypothetical protein Ta2E_06120 [Mycoplasmoidaceae bacterium]
MSKRKNIDPYWETVINDIENLYAKRAYTEGIKKLIELTDGVYIPFDYQDEIDMLEKRGKQLRKEFEENMKYVKMEKNILQKFIIVDKKICIEPMSIYLEKFGNTLDVSDEIFFEDFLNSKIISNTDKMYLINLLNQYSSNNIKLKCYNNKLKKSFTYPSENNEEREWYNNIIIIISQKLSKEPSLLESAWQVLSNIKDYYFGFTPKIDDHTIAVDILNYLHGNLLNTDGMNIIIKSVVNEENND